MCKGHQYICITCIEIRYQQGVDVCSSPQPGQRWNMHSLLSKGAWPCMVERDPSSCGWPKHHQDSSRLFVRKVSQVHWYDVVQDVEAIANQSPENFKDALLEFVHAKLRPVCSQDRRQIIHVYAPDLINKMFLCIRSGFIRDTKSKFNYKLLFQVQTRLAAYLHECMDREDLAALCNAVEVGSRVVILFARLGCIRMHISHCVAPRSYETAQRSGLWALGHQHLS